MVGEFLEFGDEREGKAGRAAFTGDAFRMVLPPEERSRVYGLTRPQDASRSSGRGGGGGLRAGRSKGHAIAAFSFGFGVATAAVAELLPVQHHLKFRQSQDMLVDGVLHRGQLAKHDILGLPFQSMRNHGVITLQQDVGEEGVEARFGGGGLGKDFGGGAAFVAPVEWLGIGVGEIGAGAGEVGGDDGEEGPEFLCFCGGWVEGGGCV